jgi:hypothetical protein
MHAIVNNQKSIFIDKTQSANNDPFLRREGKKKEFLLDRFFFLFLSLSFIEVNERTIGVDTDIRTL